MSGVALALGGAWGLVVALVTTAHRVPARAPEAPDTPGASPSDAPDASPARARAASASPGRADTAGWPRRAPVPERLGVTIRRIAGRPPDTAADRRVGWAALGTVALAAVVPQLSPLPAAWAALAPTMTARRAARAHDAAVVDQLPDVVDLVVLTTSAGLPVTSAFAAIGSRPGGPLGEGLAAAASHAARGGTTAEALALMARSAGSASRPLVEALAEHDRYGTPLRPALDRVGIEARLRRRRQAEEAARRLPITLLFPLVLTTLPAFVLLTVIPLLAGSFGSLSP
jgi:tight adherence protein C